MKEIHRSTMRRNTAFLVSLPALVIPLVSCFQDCQGTCKLFPDAEGGVLRLPPKTRREKAVGAFINSFISDSSRDEVQKFFDE